MTLLGNTTGASSRTWSSGTPGRLRSASASAGRSRSKSAMVRRRNTGGHSVPSAITRSLTSTTAPARRTPSRLSSNTTRRTARLAGEDPRDRLVPVPLPVDLLAIEAEGLQDRGVLHREEDRFPVGARVLVPRPRRDDEEVALAPVEALAVDHARAVSLEDQVHGAPGVPVGLRPDPGPQELDPARDGRHQRPAGVRIDVLHRHVVEGAGRPDGGRREPTQGVLRPIPLVVEERREGPRPLLPGGPELTDPVPALG